MILVTGGAGFIGSHVVDALVDDEEEVIVLDNFATGDRGHLNEEVEILDLDIADPAVVETIASINIKVVIHAAAQVSVAASMSNPHRDLRVNALGTANVLTGARAAGAERFVFLSTGGGIYGESDGADENTLPRPSSYYSVHKYLAERYVQLSGISYANVRLANVYGPRQRKDLEGGVVAIFAERLRNKLPIPINGTGDQSRDFVHVSDVVEAIISMAHDRRDGIWNVGTGEATSILDLLGEMEKLIAPAVKIEHGSSRPGDVEYSRLSIEKIRTQFDWHPRLDLRSGLAETLHE